MKSIISLYLRSFILLLLLVPAIVSAQGIVIKSGVVEETIFNSTTTKTDDPAGHSCCVWAPTGQVRVGLNNGAITITDSTGGALSGWLDFGPMKVDAQGNFTGESVGPVAGYSNIESIIRGFVTPDEIIAQATVGSNGGLPGGQPIVFDFGISGIQGIITPTPYFSMHFETGMSFNIIEEEVDIEAQIPSGFSLTMDSKGDGTDAEWWLVMLIGSDFYSFDINTGTFVPGITPVYQGPLIDAPDPVKFWEFGDTPKPQDFTIFFGVDYQLDSVVNEDSLIGTGHHFYYH